MESFCPRNATYRTLFATFGTLFFWRYRTVDFAIHPDIYTRWHMKNLKILALK